jgi:hypothetical protein
VVGITALAEGLEELFQPGVEGPVVFPEPCVPDPPELLEMVLDDVLERV